MTTLHPQFVGDTAVLPRSEFERLVDLAKKIEEVDLTPSENGQDRKASELELWLTECEHVAAQWEGEFDSAADVRRLRDEA